MKRHFIIFLLIFNLLNQVNSQDFSQTLKGKVIDRDSKEALIGAAVVLLDTYPLSGTITDAEGNFRLEKVKAGRHSIKVSYIGYNEVTLPEISLNTGKETILSIELTQSVIQVNGVQITASSQDKDKALNSMSTTSSRKLNMDDAQRYAGGFSDAARMVSSFAGVSAVEGDGINDLVIRGNSPHGLQWKLEGIEIPNPNHFTDGQGGSGGAFSIITSNVLSTSDFLTGAFSAEYGNASSGIMDLNLRKGNDEKKEYAFQLSIVGTEFSFEGPFSKSKGSSYLVNYRYSTFGLLSNLNLIDLGNNNRPPVFQDLALNLNFPTKKAGTFQAFFMGGQSTTGTDPIRDSSAWVKRDGRFFEVEDHAMFFGGIKHVYLFPDKKTYLKSIVSASFQGDQWKSGLLDKEYAKQTEYNDDFRYPSIKGSMVLNSKLNAKNVIRGGINFSQLYYNMFQGWYNYDSEKFDTLVEKFYTHNYYCLTTLSVYDSRFKANDGKWYNTVFNGRYVANLLAGKDFIFGKKSQNTLGINLKAFVRGGYRTSPINMNKSLEMKEVVYDEEHLYAQQLPAFSRIDVGSYFRINKIKYSYIVSVDIQNVSNRKNILGYEYSDKQENVVEVTGMGIIPILNFRIEM